MNQIETSIGMLFKKAEDYGKTTLELFKLEAIDKAADIISSLAVKLVAFIAIVLFSLFVNIGLALWIGELLGKSYYGFFIVGAFYAIILSVVYISKNSTIKSPIRKAIIDNTL